MTSRDEIAQVVREVFHSTLKVDPARLQPDTVLRDELALDSLDMVEVVYELEERFDVQIPADRVGKISTFQEVVDGLAEAIGATGEAAGEG